MCEQVLQVPGLFSVLHANETPTFFQVLFLKVTTATYCCHAMNASATAFVLHQQQQQGTSSHLQLLAAVGCISGLMQGLLEGELPKLAIVPGIAYTETSRVKCQKGDSTAASQVGHLCTDILGVLSRLVRVQVFFLKLFYAVGLQDVLPELCCCFCRHSVDVCM